MKCFTGVVQRIASSTAVRERETVFYAVALEEGLLFAAPDAAAEEIMEFQRGQIFEYLGEREDTFGRDWSMVTTGEAWRRLERWFATTATPQELRGYRGRVSLLTSLPGPEVPPAVGFLTSEAAADYNARLKQPLQVRADWWDVTRELDADAIDSFGRVVGVPVWQLPAAQADQLVEAFGGLAAMGPFPEDPGFGRLHVSEALGLVLRYDGSAWRLNDPPLSTRPRISLLANPRLRRTPDAPAEPTGPPIACWRLVGGLDPRGNPAGSVGPAPPPPARLQASARPQGDQLRGYYDLTGRAWPIAQPRTLAPRRVMPQRDAGGVVLGDASRRQAVYLEQSLPPRVVEQLRGREVRVQVMARAVAEGEGISTATVALDVEVGSLRQSLSTQVGALPTPVTVTLVVPPDATTLRVRLLPVDLSIAVLEGGRAVFDSVSLAPTDWNVELEAAPLLLRRVRSVTYQPAPRFTRARIVVSERTPEQLAEIWSEIAADDLPEGWLEMILSGEIAAGMTERQVELAWGSPEDRSESSLLRWRWVDRAASFDPDGTLLAWSVQPEREPARQSLCWPQAAPTGDGEQDG